MDEALAIVSPQELMLAKANPRAVIDQATEEANVLADVIESQKLYTVIQGKKFCRVEGWTTLASLRGCLPREVSVTEMPEGRYVAEVELVRMNDGMVLTKASAECGGPEDPMWQSRPPNARRSMAITRATGKACRVAFSWVMALSGFEVTPLEEMPEDARDVTPRSTPKVSENASVRAAAVTRPGEYLDYVFTFGKHKGESIQKVPSDYLKWLANDYYPKEIKDPAKAQYKDKNSAMQAHILEEIMRRINNAKEAEEVPF